MKELSFWGIIMALFLGSCGDKKEDKETRVGPPSTQQLDIAIGTGRVEPSDKVVMLSAESAGTIKSLEVQPGEVVQAGAVLIQLHDESEMAQYAQALAQSMTQSGAVELAKTQLKQAESDAQFAKNEWDRIARLKLVESVTEQAFRDAEQDWKQAVTQKETASQSLIQALAKLNEIKAQVAYQQTLINKKKIKAPSNGRILSIEVRNGQYLTSGINAIEFAPEGALAVWTEIDELLADQLKVGQRAIIRPQGATDTLSEAQVVYVAPALRKKSLFSDQADNLEDRRVREVQVKLLNPESGLLIGSRVECLIKIR